ncbi:MAG: methyltransferase domain-containing protein [Clostridia bacterium]|nr:methyltransferase domain-containing protein [Clostridia bacterium]
MTDVIRHYDLLIGEGNDPVDDPEPLRQYMDGWDGRLFLSALALDGTQDVLEIGVGTGRMALRTALDCRSFTGVDLSPASIERAAQHLSGRANVRLLCADFMTWETTERFNVIYSTLTFMHIADKLGAAQRIALLLKPGGRAVISLDKSQSDVLDYGTRQLRIYPDDPHRMAAHLREAGLFILPMQETEFAYLLTAIREGEDKRWGF